MPKVKEETVPVRFKWISSGADPVQFKPFGNQYEPQGLYIQIDLPISYLIETCKDGILVISPAGMAYLSHEIGKAITKSYQE